MSVKVELAVSSTTLKPGIVVSAVRVLGKEMVTGAVVVVVTIPPGGTSAVLSTVTVVVCSIEAVPPSVVVPGTSVEFPDNSILEERTLVEFPLPRRFTDASNVAAIVPPTGSMPASTLPV